MGSTVTVAVLDGERVAFGHVGDSRAYLVRGGAIQQLSADHSLVAELVRAGRLTREEAEAHPQKSVITRVLGVSADVVVDTWTLDGRPGDVVHDLLGRPQPGRRRAHLARARLGRTAGARRSRALVQAANDAGGDDNVTLVAFRLAPEQPPEPVAPPAEAASGAARHARRRPAPAGGRRRQARRLPLRHAGRRRRSAAGCTARSAVAIAGGLVCAVVLGSFFGLRWAHFVGEDPATGKVAVFTGVPVELGGGQTLYKLVRRSRGRRRLAAGRPPPGAVRPRAALAQRRRPPHRRARARGAMSALDRLRTAATASW